MIFFKGQKNLIAIFCFIIFIKHSLFVSAHDVHSSHHTKPNKSRHHHKSKENSTSIEELISAYQTTGDDTYIHLVEARVKEESQAYEQGLFSKQKDQANSQNSYTNLFIQKAWIAQVQHKFDKSLAMLDEVLLVNPRHGQVLMMTAAASGATGDYNRAKKACMQMSSALSPVFSLACQLRYVHDSKNNDTLKTAINTLRKIEINSSDLSPELKAWFHAAIADGAVKNKNWFLAEQHFDQANEFYPSVQYQASLADVLMQQKKYSAALEVLPNLAAPSIAVRRLLARTSLGEDTRRQITKMDATFKGWISNTDFLHAREMAMFYLHIKPDADLARMLARENYARQKEPEDRLLVNLTHKTGA